MTAFNVIDDPWLPVRYADGRESEIGLRAALRDAPAIADLAISFPLEYVATLRMVVTVLQGACNGPSSTAEKASWFGSHAELRPVWEEYFATWRERFELFHPSRPFLQAPIDPEIPAGTVAALRPDWASGNNATLFDHHIDRSPEALTPGEAARALLTTLLFQPKGGQSKPFYRSDSPATKALQVLVEGRSLWETLVANAPHLSDSAVRPVWEQPTHDADRADPAGTTPEGWLDRATWRSRAIRLVADPDGLVRTVQIHQHLKLSNAPPFDPYAPLRRVGDEPPALLRASPTRALWRDAEALLAGLRSEEGHPTVVASALDAFDELEELRLPVIRIVGQVVNQGKVGDVRAGRLPISRALLEDPLRLETVGALVQDADTGAKALRQAIRRAADEMGAADGWGRAARWETDYWAGLAGPFHTALGVLASSLDVARVEDDVIGPWRRVVVGAARAAYDRFSADGGRGRSPEAIGKARATLDRGLTKLRRPQEEG